MAEFNIYIFGAPYSFDLYKGNVREDNYGWADNYLSIFDYNSEEPVKMTIHRIGNKVMYSYLRYGYITSSGRPGSFFGMSVGFQDAYCADFNQIFQLFEGVFGTIKDKGIIFNTQNSNQYNIKDFSNASGEVDRIIRILDQNIRGALAPFIKPLDFPNSAPDDKKEALLSTLSENNAVWAALNQYAMVTISPSYGTANATVIVPPEVHTSLIQSKKDIKKETVLLTKKVSLFGPNLVKNKEKEELKEELKNQCNALIKELNGTINKRNTTLETINQWLEKKPKNSAALESLKDSIKEKDQDLNDLADGMSVYKEELFGTSPNSNGQKSGTNQGTTGTPPSTPKPKTNNNQGVGQGTHGTTPSSPGRENGTNKGTAGTTSSGSGQGRSTNKGTAGTTSNGSEQTKGTNKGTAGTTSSGSGQGRDHETGGDTNSVSVYSNPRHGFWHFYNKNKKVIWSVAAVCVCLLLWILRPNDQDETTTPPSPSQFEVECENLMGKAREKFEKNDWVGAYKKYKDIINKNDTAKDKYSRLQEAKDLMNRCQENHKSYCLEKVDAKKEYKDNLATVRGELNKVDYELTNDDDDIIKAKSLKGTELVETKKDGEKEKKEKVDFDIWVKQRTNGNWVDCKADNLSSGVATKLICHPKQGPDIKDADVTWSVNNVTSQNMVEVCLSNGLTGHGTISCTCKGKKKSIKYKCFAKGV